MQSWLSLAHLLLPFSQFARTFSNRRSLGLFTIRPKRFQIVESSAGAPRYAKWCIGMVGATTAGGSAAHRKFFLRHSVYVGWDGYHRSWVI